LLHPSPTRTPTRPDGPVLHQDYPHTWLRNTRPSLPFFSSLFFHLSFVSVVSTVERITCLCRLSCMC
jgi:hypothetical protein